MMRPLFHSITSIAVLFCCQCLHAQSPLYNPDADGDGMLTNNDLLSFLSWFGVSPQLVTTGCMVPGHSAYDANAVWNDGSCDTSNESNDQACEWTCNSPVSFNGYDYQTVQIGDDCWFAENLRTFSYRNGAPILQCTNWDDATQNETGAMAAYGTQVPGYICASNPIGDVCDPDWSFNSYGLLYNGYAIENGGNGNELCPTGWHVSSPMDWNNMVNHLGGAALAASKLKAQAGWNGSNGSNSSGFNGLPGGEVVGNDFERAGDYGFWWCYNSSTGDRQQRFMTSEVQFVITNSTYISPTNGASVRCVKNAD